MTSNTMKITTVTSKKIKINLLKSKNKVDNDKQYNEKQDNDGQDNDG